MLVPFIGTHKSNKDRWVNPDHIVMIENEIEYTEDDQGNERWTVEVVILRDYFVKMNQHDPGHVMSQMLSVHFRKEIEAIDFRNFLIEMCNQDRSGSCDPSIADSLRNLASILDRILGRQRRGYVIRRVKRSLPAPIVKPAPSPKKAKKRITRRKKSKKEKPSPNWHRKGFGKEVNGDEQ